MARTVAFAGKDLELVGPQLGPGDKAPDFRVVDTQLNTVTLADTRGKVRIFASVPSLDTGVCNKEAHTFNERALEIPGVAIYVVSMDLPFAQKRWCGQLGDQRLQTLSDHREASFGTNWGVLIKDVRLLARAVFVVDADDTIRYVELVRQTGTEPDYDRALAAVRECAGIAAR